MINLTNETGYDVFVYCYYDKYFLPNGETLRLDTDITEFKVHINKSSFIKEKIIAELSKFEFVLSVAYRIVPNNNDVNIVFRYKCVNGFKTERYEFIIPYSSVPIFAVSNAVVDKDYLYPKLQRISKKEKRQLAFVMLLDMLQSMVYFFIPLLLLFIIICTMTDIIMAVKIVGGLLLISSIVGIPIRYALNSVRNKFDKSTSAEKQSKKIYKNCTSLLSDEYINLVLNSDSFE